MLHQGMILMDIADETSWQRGTVEVDGVNVSVAVGQAQVGIWPVRNVGLSADTAGRYWIAVNAGRLLFAPDNAAPFDDEVRAHAMRTKLEPPSVEPARPSSYAPMTGGQPAPYPGRAPSPKNPGGAAVLSALWTGLGQMYNGRIGWGLFLMFVQFINFLLMFVLIGFVTGLVVWIFGIIDAYQGAERYNRSIGLYA